MCSTVLPSANAFTVQAPDQQRPLSNLLSYVHRLITKAALSPTASNANSSSNKSHTIEMAFDIIQNCAVEIEGRSLVYKSNFFQLCVEHFERVSRDANRYDKRFLDVLVNITFFNDGQTSVLKSAGRYPQGTSSSWRPCVVELFAIIIRVAHSSPSPVLQRQALLILRNLAFSSTHKARIVSERKLLENTPSTDRCSLPLQPNTSQQ